jgi:hypothetical protein
MYVYVYVYMCLLNFLKKSKKLEFFKNKKFIEKQKK